MKLTGGEIVVRALRDEGIRFTFGIPGTHNIELYDALADSDEIRPVLITDEQSAGFMADGLWRATGSLGCVNIVPGAGLTHALSGIAEAYMDGVPMLVLGCGIRRDQARAYQLHEIDQLAIAAPVTKGVFRPRTGAELYPVLRDACALARAGTPGPVMVEVSVDLYLTRHEVSLDGYTQATPVVPAASAEAVRKAAAALTADGARPLLYAGLGAQGAAAELVALAERLEAPVATTIQGKGVFPESHPLFLWNGLGAAAPPFVRAAAAGRTITLAVGCRFSEVGTGSWSFAPPGPLLHVDINPEVLNRNFPAEQPIVSDAKNFLTALLAELADRPTAGRDQELRSGIAAGHAAVRAASRVPAGNDRVTPARLLEALQRVLGPDTIFTTDSGNGTFLAMESLRLDRPGKFLAPVDYSCMGYSVPAAIGARLGMPEAPVVALAGDGAFLMTGLELLTAASQGAPVLVVVLRDRELAQIAQFQSTAFGRTTASVLPDYHVGSLAEAVGIEWLRLDADRDIDEVLETARATLAAGRPVLIDTAIEYGGKTWFTRGVVKTMLWRMSWPDRLRFITRAVRRRFGR
jgi:acetolactate synthase-1/2/3 large subunit